MQKFFILISLMLFISCSDQNGGAVEIAWVIRGSDQTARSCNENFMGNDAITQIKISVIPKSGIYAGKDLCEENIITNCKFECSSDYGGTMHGVTNFNIPSGVYYIGIVPLRKDGSIIPQNKVQTPSPMQKTIIGGELTFTGVWQIVINLSSFH